MQADIILINAETDGAIPIKCNLKNVGSKVQLEYGGIKGWRIQIPIDAIRAIFDDELHGWIDMAENRGKKFETVIREAFEKVPNVSIDRLHDQTNGFKGSQNICDFIVYREPYEYYFECKSVHGASLPFSNITDTQWNGLLEKSKIEGVFAGVICWWIDKDVTAFIPIWYLDYLKQNRKVKSINVNSMLKESEELEKYIDFKNPHFIQIKGKKKRVFFDYSMEDFFTHFE